MSNNQQTVQVFYGGIGVLGILGILFICLKLFEVTVVATWSWWWVLAPFWIGPALVLGIMGIVLLVALLIGLTSLVLLAGALIIGKLTGKRPAIPGWARPWFRK